MTDNRQDANADRVDRRSFLAGISASLLAGVASARSAGAPASESSTRPAASTRPAGLPARRLGRTNLSVPVIGLGTGPMGHAFYSPEAFEEVTEAALDAGMRYIDTSPIYDVAQERLVPILARRRKDILLASKTLETTRDGVVRAIESTLKELRTGYLDVGHLHNVGRQPPAQVLGKDGALAGMREAKRRGLIRYIGCTGHLKPERFPAVIDTGEIDIVMVAMNFVDRFTYGFEDKVLPTARKHDCGILCMKVYGGVISGWGGYRKKEPGRLVSDEHRQDAFDYALSLPGVASCVVGLKSREELRLALDAVRAHRPLQGDRQTALLARGRRMADAWGPHFGT